MAQTQKKEKNWKAQAEREATHPKAVLPGM